MITNRVYLVINTYIYIYIIYKDIDIKMSSLFTSKLFVLGILLSYHNLQDIPQCFTTLVIKQFNKY